MPRQAPQRPRPAAAAIRRPQHQAAQPRPPIATPRRRVLPHCRPSAAAIHRRPIDRAAQASTCRAAPLQALPAQVRPRRVHCRIPRRRRAAMRRRLTAMRRRATHRRTAAVTHRRRTTTHRRRTATPQPVTRRRLLRGRACRMAELVYQDRNPKRQRGKASLTLRVTLVRQLVNSNWTDH